MLLLYFIFPERSKILLFISHHFVIRFRVVLTMTGKIRNLKSQGSSLIITRQGDPTSKKEL